MNIERCCACDDPTGKAGPGDGSLYTDGGVGPFCDSCYTGAQWADAELTRLRSLAARAEDVEGMAQLFWLLDAPKADPDAWNKFTPRLKQPYLENANAVAAYLKEGK